MKSPDKTLIFDEIIEIIKKLHDISEYTDDISADTYFFEDLGFESIDIVVLAANLEEYFQQSFPFTDFLAELGEQRANDIKVSQVIDFIVENLDRNITFKGNT